MMICLIIFFVVGLFCLDMDEFVFVIKYLCGYLVLFSVVMYGMVVDRFYKFVVFFVVGGVVVVFFLDVV